MSQFPHKFQSILSAAKSLGLDSSDYIFQKEFSDGLSHDTALVNYGDSQLVVKVFNQSAQLRDQAITGQQFAATLGIAPQVIFASAELGLLVSQYIPSPSLAHRAVSPANLERIAKALKTLHAQPLKRVNEEKDSFDMLKFSAQYVKSAGKWGLEEHSRLVPKIADFQAESTIAFCHNDLVAPNIFIDKSQALFIDWEYAQVNNIYFDLAAVVFYLDLSASQRSEFLLNYFDRSETAKDIVCLELGIAVLLWGDVLWHIDSFGMRYLPQLEHKLNWLKRYGYINRLP